MTSVCEFKHPIGKDPDTGDESFDHYNHWNYIDSSDYYSFNRGAVALNPQVFSKLSIIDRRIEVPLDLPLKIKFPAGKKWRPYQVPAIEAFTAGEDGLMQAPPRSGKTLLMAASICLERQKTIVFAHQTDLLVQMQRTFETFTNLKELQTAYRPILGIAESWEDFENLDIVLCTKQTFDPTQNREHARQIQKMFGAVYVDEAHYVGSDIYSKLVNRFHAKTRRGVTATPYRKDGRDQMIWGVLGPVLHKVSREEAGVLPLKVVRINTGMRYTKKDSWVNTLTDLAKNEVRNKMICRYAKMDYDQGATILIMTDRSRHCKVLKDMLDERGVPTLTFTGKNKRTKRHDYREEILNEIRSGSYRVLIIMRGMTTGLDIPSATHIYNALPSSNVRQDEDEEKQGGGGYQQQIERVLTPLPGKVEGVCRDFVDDFGLAYGAWEIRRMTYEKINAKIVSKDAEEKAKAKPVIGASSSTEM